MTNAEDTTDRLDALKLSGALVVALGALGGFHYFSELVLPVRLVVLLAGLGVALALASFTATGRSAWQYLGASRNEVRKVVWPTRQETVQMTLMVFVMVMVVALFMWLLDWLLAWAVRGLIA